MLTVSTYRWLPALLLFATAPAFLAPDASTRIDFTISGGGHQGERVQIRDVYPEVTSPYAQFYHSGITFGIDKPILELRGGKLAPKLWAVHFILVNGGGSAGMRVGSVQPAAIYNGDNSAAQQSWFPQIMLPPLKEGTLSATLSPNPPPGRLRGTFAGTLVDDKGNEVTISAGSFDLPRRPDVE
jgi:hypothetical protein